MEYPTREQAEAMVQNRCPTMICANCKVNRWCDVDGVKVSKSAGEAFLAMHTDIDELRVALKVADINLRNAKDLIKRLTAWAIEDINIEVWDDVVTSEELRKITEMLAEAEAMTAESSETVTSAAVTLGECQAEWMADPD